MRRRILAATSGAAAVAVLGAMALAASPWRPAGLLVGLLLIGVAAPAFAAGGAAAGMKFVGTSAAGIGRSTLRLAALGAPISVLFVLFVVDLVGVGGPGSQQGAALVLGCGLAAGLAARFGDA